MLTAIDRPRSDAINETSPGSLNVGDDTVETLEAVLRKMRGLMLGGQRYAGVIRFELVSPA